LEITKVEIVIFLIAKALYDEKDQCMYHPLFFGAKVWIVGNFWEIFVTNLMILKTKIVHR